MAEHNVPLGITANNWLYPSWVWGQMLKSLKKGTGGCLIMERGETLHFVSRRKKLACNILLLTLMSHVDIGIRCPNHLDCYPADKQWFYLFDGLVLRLYGCCSNYVFVCFRATTGRPRKDRWRRSNMAIGPPQPTDFQKRADKVRSVGKTTGKERIFCHGTTVLNFVNYSVCSK